MKTLYILGFDYQDFVKWRLSVNGEGRSTPNTKQLHYYFGERCNIPEERTRSQVLRFNEGIAFRVELAMT
jgi:hypothetical protein